MGRSLARQRRWDRLTQTAVRHQQNTMLTVPNRDLQSQNPDRKKVKPRRVANICRSIGVRTLQMNQCVTTEAYTLPGTGNRKHTSQADKQPKEEVTSDDFYTVKKTKNRSLSAVTQLGLLENRSLKDNWSLRLNTTTSCKTAGQRQRVERGSRTNSAGRRRSRSHF